MTAHWPHRTLYQTHQVSLNSMDGSVWNRERVHCWIHVYVYINVFKYMALSLHVYLKCHCGCCKIECRCWCHPQLYQGRFSSLFHILSSLPKVAKTKRPLCGFEQRQLYTIFTSATSVERCSTIIYVFPVLGYINVQVSGWILVYYVWATIRRAFLY